MSRRRCAAAPSSPSAPSARPGCATASRTPIGAATGGFASAPSMPWAATATRAGSRPSPPSSPATPRRCASRRRPPAPPAATNRPCPHLKPLLEDEDPEVQEAAIAALGEIGGGEARRGAERDRRPPGGARPRGRGCRSRRDGVQRGPARLPSSVGGAIAAERRRLRTESATSAGGVVYRLGERGMEVVICRPHERRHLGTAEGHAGARRRPDRRRDA